MRRAVIDVGTNSVKLLVGEASANQVVPLYEQSEQTRLGQGFYSTHQLQPAAIAKTARAVARFAAEARAHNPEWVRVIATSAVRDALNQGELLSAIDDACGLDVEIITGEQEARWVFAGVHSDPALSGNRLLIVDVGGGSTEFILGDQAKQLYAGSFRIGTVRLLEDIRPADPPNTKDWERCRASVAEFIERDLMPALKPHLLQGVLPDCTLVGTGGTTSILASMSLRLQTFDRNRMDGLLLSREQVWDFQRSLWSVPLAERQHTPGLPPNRADVILFGLAIFALVMERAGFAQLRVSTRGLRFGALLEERPRG